MTEVPRASKYRPAELTSRLVTNGSRAPHPSEVRNASAAAPAGSFRPQPVRRPVDQGQLLGASGPDTIGFGGAINGLSGANRDFLAAGGIGLLIGDGQLNYAPERILEAYYAFAINKSFTFAADYQFIANPAYNADRGPVSIFSGRLHGEF